jgi:NAD(P)-dependent dehydrogenase (short-subunit alcohol dehydrogenase family)
MKRVLLVTGASSGIGLATAIAAARAGFTTIGTVRSGAARLLAAAATAGVTVDVWPLELTSQESIESCVDGVLQAHGRLDAVVNNAGIANSSPTLELSTMDLLRTQLEVNFLGVVATSRAAMPHLRATRGRLLTVSSVRGVLGQPFNEAYSAAKFAVEGFMEALAPVAASVGVTVSLIEPAAVLDTSFVASSTLDPTRLLAASGPYEPAFRAYRSWVATGAVEGAQTAAEVAAVIVDALTCADPAPRIPTSDYARAYLGRKLKDPSGRDLLKLTRSWVTPKEPAVRGYDSAGVPQLSRVDHD